MVAQEAFAHIKKHIPFFNEFPLLDQEQCIKEVWKSRDINDFELEINNLVKNLQ